MRKSIFISAMRIVRFSPVAFIVTALLVSSGPGARSSSLDSHYGVVDQWGGQGGTGSLDIKMRDLGAKWIRAGWNWDQIETADNVYDPTNLGLMDDFVTAMNAIGVNIYHNFNYTPAWARTGGDQRTPPNNPAKYTEYITYMVNRYKGSIHYWGFWNEVNIAPFWTGDYNWYIQNMLIPGIQAVKAADPTAKTVVGELSTSGDDVTKLKTMLQAIDAAGLHSQVDVISHHSYDGGDTASGRLADMDTLRNMIVSIGWGEKDFWCTETGWQSGGTNGETNQANQLIGMMQGMDARPWWKKTFWYTMTEGSSGQFGLLRPDQSQKPSYNQYQAYIAAHTTTIGANVSNAGFEGYTKAASGGYNGAVPEGWTPFCHDAGTVPGNLTFSDDTTVKDAGNRSVKITAAGGKEGGLYAQFNTSVGDMYTVTVKVVAGTGYLGIDAYGGTNGGDEVPDYNSGHGVHYVGGSGTLTAGPFAAHAGKCTIFFDQYSGSGNYDTLTVIPMAPTDISGPTFGSVSPTLTTSPSPTITVSVQDTGVGLAPDSIEYQYSTDGGATYSQWISNVVLHSDATVGAGHYAYDDFYHPSSYTIAAGDTFMYDIDTNNAGGPSGAVDVEMSSGPLRDSGIKDQNGLSDHPATDIHTQAYHTWYHRYFDLSSRAGNTISCFTAAHDGSTASPSDFYVRNVMIMNGSTVKLLAFSPTYNHDAHSSGPGVSGATINFLRVDPNPLNSGTPISCTGSYGQIDSQTAAAGTVPLANSTANRVKFAATDVYGNLTISSSYSITVDSVGPTCTIGAPSPGSVTSGGAASYPVTYADSVTGIASVNLRNTDVTVNTLSGTASGSVSVSNGSTATPTVTVTTSGSGTLKITIAAGRATDNVGNADVGATSGTPLTVIDATPPGNVTGFTATRGDTQISLAWTKPGDADLAGVKIMWKTSGYPSSATDGTQCYSSTGTSFVHTGLTNGLTYYYKAFAYDGVPNYASGVQASAVPADVTAPAAVTALAIIKGDGRNYLSWTNPSTSDFAGTKILFKTTGYPTSAADGTVVCNRTAAPSSNDSFTQISLTDGATYYYSAFAYDEVPNYSISATASGVPVRFDPAQAKLLANNAAITLTTGAVSAVWPDSFYVQCVDKPIGIRVVEAGHSAGVGQLAWARGMAQTDAVTGEKYILADWAQSYGSGTAKAYAVPNAGLGGADWQYVAGTGAGQQGVAGAVGPSNIGLFVWTWGKVTQRQTTAPKYFYIDDGSGLTDGTKTGTVDNIGVRVIADPASYATGSYVAVNGIVSCFNSSGLRREILPVSVQTLRP